MWPDLVWPQASLPGCQVLGETPSLIVSSQSEAGEGKQPKPEGVTIASPQNKLNHDINASIMLKYISNVKLYVFVWT